MAPRGSNQNYWITIDQPTQGLHVVGDMSEHFGLHLSSFFDSPRGTPSGTVASEITSAVGGDIVYQPMTKRVWQGTSPVSFDLEIAFDAEVNSQADVHNTLVYLGTLALPGAFGSVLFPPNPTRVDADINRVQIQIGKSWLFPSCTIDSVTINEEERLNFGWPIAGSIRIAATTDTVYSKQDFLQAGQCLGIAPDVGSLSPADTAALAALRGLTSIFKSRV